jgi:uncharacterized protein (DUF302 family)
MFILEIGNKKFFESFIYENAKILLFIEPCKVIIVEHENKTIIYRLNSRILQKMINNSIALEEITQLHNEIENVVNLIRQTR